MSEVVTVFRSRLRDDAHRAVWQQGRDDFYTEYSVTVADMRRERAWLEHQSKL